MEKTNRAVMIKKNPLKYRQIFDTQLQSLKSVDFRKGVNLKKVHTFKVKINPFLVT